MVILTGNLEKNTGILNSVKTYQRGDFDHLLKY